MKNFMKKFVSALMIVVMLFTMVPLQGLVGVDISGWFASEAEAAGISDSDNEHETYWAMSHNEAVNFIGFIYDKSKVTEEMLNAGNLYKFLTGGFEKGSIGEYSAKLAFLMTAKSNLSQCIDSFSQVADGAKKNLLDYLVNEVDVGSITLDTAEEIVDTVLHYSSEIIDKFGTNAADILKKLEIAKEFNDQLTTIPDLIENLFASLNGFVYMWGSSKAAMYQYVSSYISNRKWKKTNDQVFDILNEYNKLAGLQNGFYDPNLDWASDDHIAVLESFGDYIYYVMESFDKDWVTGNDEIYESSSVKVLDVRCPTDVYIYDTEDSLLVSIENNVITKYSKFVFVSVYDSQKRIVLPDSLVYQIKIIGTDEGEMDYSVTEISENSIMRTIEYKSVPLTKGCEYIASMPKEVYTDVNNYNLTSDKGEIIEATYDSLPPVEDNIIDVIVAEELFDGFPVEVIDLVADTMFNMKSVVDLSAYDISTDDSVALFSAVAKYYPAEYSLIANSDFTYKIIVSPNLDRIMKIRFYYGDDANLSTYQKRVNDLNAEIDALVTKVEGMNEFEKALYIHDYIVLNSEYDLELLDYMEKNNFRLPGELRSEKYTEYSILVNGTGVCGSYALAYRAVLNAAGMECLYLSSGQMNHAWNLVKIDGKWYHVDCCWDDPVPDTYGRAKRTYFLRTDKEIMELKHFSWTPGKYKANSEKYSEMPRDYDVKQKYDDGNWYYLESGNLYSSDEYGKNETLLTTLTANSIDADNGNVYYADGRFICEYNIDTQNRNIVYMLSASELGSEPALAYVQNMYVDGSDINIYKRIYKDEERITVYETLELEKDSSNRVTGIEISDSKMNLEINSSSQLTVSIVSEGVIEDYEISWYSSDKSVATVDATGKVVGKKLGNVKITAKFGCFNAQCDVEVIPPPITGIELSASEVTVDVFSTYKIGYDLLKSAPTEYNEVQWTTSDNNIVTVDDKGVITGKNIGQATITAECMGYTASCIVNVTGNGLSGGCGDNAFWSYDVESKTLTISGTGDLASYTADNEWPWHSLRDEIKNIIIDEGITSITAYAFTGINGITEIKIPDSVKYLRAGVFRDCSSLETVCIGAGLVSIGLKFISMYLDADTVFENCNNLKEFIVSENNTNFVVDEYGALLSADKKILYKYPAGSKSTEYVFPDTVTKIIPQAFEYAINLEKVTLNGRTGEIPTSAFENCENLKIFNFPDELPSNFKIGDCAFWGCESLERITIPKEASSIGSSAFGMCSKLADLDLGKGDLNIIGVQAFIGCTSLQNLIVSESVTAIDLCAFKDCENLKTVVIHDMVMIIQDDVFLGCTSLEEITVNENNLYYSSDGYGVLYDKNKTELIHYPAASKNVYYSIPESVTNIRDLAFYGASNLKTVVVPESVDYITTTYFKECSDLCNVVIYNGDCRIEGYSFDNRNATIYSYSNSAVQAYAEEYGYNFVAIDTEPHEHNYLLMDYAEATEGVDGYEYYECYCGEASYTTTLHYYSEETTTNPTCTLEGTKTQTCLNCGDVNVIETTPATGKHDYKLVLTVPGDCTTAPVHTYECSICYDSYTKEGRIDDGHNYVETVVEPTCDEKGCTFATCSKCGETVIYDFTSPTGHEFTITHSEDYCEAHGTLEYSCKKCDYYEQIASDGSNLITETVTVESTCTKSGTKTEICTLCKATISTEILNPLSHDYSEEFTVDKAATCISEGSKSQHCTRCDAKRAVTVIEATGHQNTSIINTVASTCAKNGYTGDTFCYDCNSVIASGTATEKLSHNESDWITDRTSTCTAEGSKHTECTVCEEVIKTESIAKIPHEYTSVVTKPSCENGGYTTYTCSNCSDSYVSDKTPATGHNYVDGVCTACGESKIDNCSHMCHKSGFMGFIWKIVRFFWKLFGMNPVCNCGVKHY